MTTPFRLSSDTNPHTPWNKGTLVGQKKPLKLKEIWAIRTKLQMSHKIRDLALFNLAIDSKLRGCDLVSLHVHDVSNGGHVQSRAMVVQRKTGHPVQFEITEVTRDAIEKWLEVADLSLDQYLFPSRKDHVKHLTTRQYGRIVKTWVSLASLDPSEYGTHSLRRTKATLIYRRTKNLRAVQILLGHTKIESTVRYLGIEVDDALEMAEQTEI
jgi:integrase